MSISKAFTLGVVVSSGGQINEIVSHNISPGLETLLLKTDGQVDPTYAAVMFQSPILSFSSAAIARALGIAGISGLAINAAANDFWMQKYQKGGTRMTSTNSVKFTASNGILCPRQIEASSRSFATISYDLAATSADGTTAPLTITTGASMPSITAADQLYTVGPVKINGTQMEGIKRITVDLGLQISVMDGDGEVYPTFAAIQARQPRITVKSTHADFAAESGMGFVTAQGSTDSLVYLRKIAQNGTRVAAGTSEHISFTVDDGLVTINSIDSSDDPDGASIEAVIEPVFDGTNAILVISTAAAIA